MTDKRTDDAIISDTEVDEVVAEVDQDESTLLLFAPGVRGRRAAKPPTGTAPPAPVELSLPPEAPCRDLNGQGAPLGKAGSGTWDGRRK